MPRYGPIVNLKRVSVNVWITITCCWMSVCHGYSNKDITFIPCDFNSKPPVFRVTLRKVPKFCLISWCGNLMESHNFRKVSGESPETLRKLCASTKFSHQEIRQIFGILRSAVHLYQFTLPHKVLLLHKSSFKKEFCKVVSLFFHTLWIPNIIIFKKW